MLAKTAGVKRLVVVINKMDDPTVNWDKERYDECCSKLLPFLKQCGYNPKTEMDFMPVSGFTGANLKECLTKDTCSWYSGPSLLEFLDTVGGIDRKSDAPFMMPISEKYRVCFWACQRNDLFGVIRIWEPSWLVKLNLDECGKANNW